MTATPNELLIIGAGLSGLMTALTVAQAARAQGRAPRPITVLDKGRSVGGRLATRRIGAGRADHGAQFFTVRDEQFKRHVDGWQAAGLVFPWATGWSNGSGDDSPTDGYPRYAVAQGMNNLAKQLAAALAEFDTVQIMVNVRVEAVGHSAGRWQVNAADGTEWRADALVLTAPVPQSLALLDAGNVGLTDDNRAALERIRYAPCLCGLFLVDGPVLLPAPGAIQRPNAPISWIADNQRKGISPDATVITVHAGPDLSRSLYDEADELVGPILEDSLAPYLGPEATIQQRDVKRWRYALPQVLHAERFIRAEGIPHLYFGGDAFGGPRMEGAALSGMEIGEFLAGGAA